MAEVGTLTRWRCERDSDAEERKTQLERESERATEIGCQTWLEKPRGIRKYYLKDWRKPSREPRMCFKLKGVGE
ncbi:hypothetical protein NPIL_680581 [Nephila pilipes]|uniref:Uncharacterized protein n=1 Tax=Nephila pilipes TaxID=299642 RepID=A0A8X6NM69_NEPPI|nr:hypothetical protein NPIL_680581 [Nephila pilipes]